MGSYKTTNLLKLSLHEFHDAHSKAAWRGAVWKRIPCCRRSCHRNKHCRLHLGRLVWESSKSAVLECNMSESKQCYNLRIQTADCQIYFVPSHCCRPIQEIPPRRTANLNHLSLLEHSKVFHFLQERHERVLMVGHCTPRQWLRRYLWRCIN